MRKCDLMCSKTTSSSSRALFALSYCELVEALFSTTKPEPRELGLISCIGKALLASKSMQSWLGWYLEAVEVISCSEQQLMIKLFANSHHRAIEEGLWGRRGFICV